MMNISEQDRMTSELKFELKQVLTRTLSSFSCISSANLNQNQKNILEVLAMPNYNCDIEGDYKLVGVLNIYVNVYLTKNS